MNNKGKKGDRRKEKRIKTRKNRPLEREKERRPEKGRKK